MINISVIIPNWNGANLLSDCLESLKVQTYKNFEIIIVDNNSKDNSVPFIEKNYSNVKIIKLNKNYGFARAINEGVKLSKSKYVVLLNNDTKVDKKWLSHLIKTAEKHPEVSSVGSKLFNYFNRKIIDGVGISLNEIGQAKSIGWEEKDNGQYEKEMYVFGVTGGASLFVRNIFIKVGMFDEKYFMYSEEVDFAFRSQFLGYKSIYCPKAVVYHKHKMSSCKKPHHLEYWQFKNMTQTIIKDLPLSLMLRKWRLVKIILVHFNTVIYQIRNGYIWPPIAVELWLVINFPRLLIKRYKTQKTRKVSDNYLEEFLIPKKINFRNLWFLKK